MDDETLLQRFLDSTLSADGWRHREHVKVAYLLLRRYPLHVAIGQMQQGLQALNAAQGVPDEPGRGYHETKTQAWMRLVDFTLQKFGPATDSDQFVSDHPEIAHPNTLRLFYSRERLLSTEAKSSFLPPDLHPLKAWHIEPLPVEPSKFAQEPRSVEAKIVIAGFGVAAAAILFYLLAGGRGQVTTLTVSVLLLTFASLPVFIATSAIGRRHSTGFWASQRARSIATGVYLALTVCVGLGSRIWSNTEGGGVFLPLGIAAMVGMPIIVMVWLFTREVKPRPAKARPPDSQPAAPHPLD